ncbi:MAG: glycosyltransferase [Ignavibacteriaceae bacterium]|jgi:cellulose synthase/poly-beta-1,6-N-acetylglucosamine synthase-like glycosyltransferase
MFELIFLLAMSGYFLQTVWFIMGLQKKFPKKSFEELPTATVIVAARNEESNIGACLEALNNLEYPEGKLEIILVDDKSTDKTGEIISSFINDKPKFKKIVTKKEIGHLKGKTNAIANAIKQARGEIILTTDADCIVSPTWAKTLASYYEEDVAIVNGFTVQNAHTQFAGMQHLDFVFLLSVASGTINFDKPLSCIGNNMSFRKSAYNEVGGYENLPFSVTEDFNLLFAIHKLKKYKIIYPLDINGLVTTLPCPDLKTLYRQKKRWGVGGMKAPLRGFLIMSLGWVAHLSIILLPFFYTSAGLSLLFFKLIIDFLFLFFVLNELKLTSTLKYFFAFEIYYILYVVLLPFAVLPSRKVLWKGREY